jgi:hypothetical protein
MREQVVPLTGGQRRKLYTLGTDLIIAGLGRLDGEPQKTVVELLGAFYVTAVEGDVRDTSDSRTLRTRLGMAGGASKNEQNEKASHSVPRKSFFLRTGL